MVTLLYSFGRTFLSVPLRTKRWAMLLVAGGLLVTNVGQAIAQAEEHAEKITPIQKMDGATRAKVLAALAGLVILGFGMVLLIWLGGQVTRRYMRGSGEKRLPATRAPDDDWAKKPLKENKPLSKPDAEA